VDLPNCKHGMAKFFFYQRADFLAGVFESENILHRSSRYKSLKPLLPNAPKICLKSASSSGLRTWESFESQHVPHDIALAQVNYYLPAELTSVLRDVKVFRI